MRGAGDAARRFLERTLTRLLHQRRRRRIAGAFWFAWQDVAAPVPHCSFCQYAGLFDSRGDPKPAWLSLRELLAKNR